KVDDRTFPPIGQLKRNDLARFQPDSVEIAGKPLRTIMEIAAGEPVLAVDQQDSLRVGGHPLGGEIGDRSIGPVTIANGAFDAVGIPARSPTAGVLAIAAVSHEGAASPS